MDIRGSRFFDTSHGQISVFLEIRNVYNKSNLREVHFDHAGIYNGKTRVVRSRDEHWLPLLPSFGISWEF
jgi:hypothetical protein